MFLSERLTIYIVIKNTINTTNLNNIVLFSFCRSLYQYITTVYIFLPDGSSKFAYYTEIPYCSSIIHAMQMTVSDVYSAVNVVVSD